MPAWVLGVLISGDGYLRVRGASWWALLGVDCWWSGWETVASDMRWLSGCRRSELLPSALAVRETPMGRVGCVWHERPTRTPGAWAAGLRTTRGW